MQVAIPFSAACSVRLHRSPDPLGHLPCLSLTVVTYLIFFQIPADPARYLVQAQASPASDLSIQLEAARKELGVDKPIYVQYGRFLKRVVRLDLGTSYSRRITSAARRAACQRHAQAGSPGHDLALFRRHSPLPLDRAAPGTLGALYPGTHLDRFILIFVLLGISTHPLILGFFFRQTFAYRWRILPHGVLARSSARPRAAALSTGHSIWSYPGSLRVPLRRPLHAHDPGGVLEVLNEQPTGRSARRAPREQRVAVRMCCATPCC